MSVTDRPDTSASPPEAADLRTATSPDLHLLVAGSRVEPEMRDGGFVFRLVLPCAGVRLVSRSSRPSEIGAGPDDRRLGYRVRMLTLTGENWRRPIPLDHPGLFEGFHDIEPNGMRWTDGNAPLPDGLFADGRGPAELHVEGLALPAYRVAPADAAALFARFESLGDNCEFGLVQRHFEIEPLSLFRWAGTDAARLVLGLCRRFDGLGDPAFTELGLDGEPPEYKLRDRRYLGMHTWTYESQSDAARQAEILAAGCARLRLLRRKLLADIEAGRRIFVFRASNAGFGVASFYAVHAALRGIGPAPLLCVTLAATPEQVGQVEALGDGLYLGHIDQFSPAPISFAIWRRLCEATVPWSTAPGDEISMTHSDVPSGTDAAQVLAAVVRILESVAARPHPGIGLETALDTLDGVDSLRLLETVALAEERFGVQVDTGGLDGLETVGDIVRLISRQLPR